MKYIESTRLPDGTYDHTEVREAYEAGCPVEFEAIKDPTKWQDNGGLPIKYWFNNFPYRAQVPDTYGIHESSSTLREVKGDAGPAVAEMLLDRIKQQNDKIEELEVLSKLYYDAWGRNKKTIHDLREIVDELTSALQLCVDEIAICTDEESRWRNSAKKALARANGESNE